jgi:hypothetical protein
MLKIIAYSKGVGAVIKNELEYFCSQESSPSEMREIKEGEAYSYVWKWGYQLLDPDIPLTDTDIWTDKVKSSQKTKPKKKQSKNR